MLQRGRSAILQAASRRKHGEQKEFPQWVREADRFSEMNRLRTDSSASIDWDQEAGGFVADPHPYAVRHDSSCHSLALTLVAFMLALALFYEVMSTWLLQAPSINEVTTEAMGDAAAPIPSTALTIVLENMPEGEALKYVWPVFTWVDITNGFTNRSITSTLLEPEVGSSCELDGGYMKDSASDDHGSAAWPVFCVNANEVERAVDAAMRAGKWTHGRATQLSGRFGDPSYSHLEVKLMRCGAGVLSPGLQGLFEANDGGGGNCATDSEVQTLGLKNSWQYPVDVWFQFRREDWSKQASEVSFEREELSFQRGPLAGKNDNAKDSAWNWVVYETPSMNMTSSFEAAQAFFNIDLRLNTAKVDTVKAIRRSSVNQKEFKWFNFDNYMRSPSGTTSSDFLTRPLFSANLRVAMMQRQVEVRYQTVAELVNETGSTWAFAAMVVSLLLGVGPQVLWDLGTYMWHTLYAHESPVDDPRVAVQQQQLEQQLQQQQLQQQLQPPQRTTLATQDELLALKEQVQRLADALTKATGGVEMPEQAVGTVISPTLVPVSPTQP